MSRIKVFRNVKSCSKAEPPTLNMGPADFCETFVSVYVSTRHYILQDPNHQHSCYFPAEYSPSGIYKGDFFYFEERTGMLYFY